MLTSKVARRYAQGLLDFSQEAGQTAVVYAEMKDVSKILSNSPDLRLFFATPFIDYKKKLAAAQEIFKGFSPVVQNLVKLVITHGRETHLDEIAQGFITKVDQLNGVQKISITSAVQLSQKTVEDILKSTSLVNAGSQFDLETVVKPEILGGYILRVGDQQVDASVKTKLNKVQKEFQLN